MYEIEVARHCLGYLYPNLNTTSVPASNFTDRVWSVYTGDGSLLDLGGSCLGGWCMALRPSMVLMSLIWNRGMDGGFEDLWGMNM